MYTLLIVALLLALFFDTAAATSPVTMDPTLSTEFTYPDPEGILDAFCEICGISINCMHAVAVCALYHHAIVQSLTNSDEPTTVAAYLLH
jgi:hypothetical protein